MPRISADRRRVYGLGLGALLLVDLAGGAAAVVARASSPKPTPATAPAPAAGAPAAPAAAGGPSDCGHGTATALAVLDRTATGFVLRATVDDNTDRTIEIDRLVVQARYADGVRTFTAAVAGLQIASGATNGHIALPDSASASPPLAYAVTAFAFHAAGRPDCAAR